MEKTSLRRLYDDGLLFEINRQILHPVGLALALEWPNETSEGEPTGVHLLKDSDPEGTVFAADTFLDGVAKSNAFMAREGRARHSARKDAVGFVIQDRAEVPETK